MSPTPEDIGSLVTDLTDNRIGRRQFLSRAMALGLSGSAASVLLAACGGSSTSGSSSSQGSAAGKPPTTTLTYRPQTDIQDLDPAFWVSQDDVIVFDCIYEGLVTFKPGTWKVVNQLAESFEPSSDGLKFHFTLKKGIEWQKGYGEVRASDVKFSYERIAGLTKPKLNSPYSGDWSALDSVQVTGPYEGTIILKQPFAPLMHSTLPATSGKVLPEKAVTKLGKSFSTNPVGSGPYEFVNWVPKQHTTLKRFANYSGASSAFAAKAPWSTIQTQVIDSDNTAFEAISSGTVAFGYMPPALAGQAQSSSSLHVYSKPTLNYYFLAISQKNIPNLNLRRAIRSAIDVPGIIKAAYNGKYTRAYGIIPQSMGIGYWADAPRYDQDLALAKQYLHKSGRSNVTLNLAVVNDQPDEAAAQVIAADLAQIGVSVNVRRRTRPPSTPFRGTAAAARTGSWCTRTSSPSLTRTGRSSGSLALRLACGTRWTGATRGSPACLTRGCRTYDVSKRDQFYVQTSKLWDAQVQHRLGRVSHVVLRGPAVGAALAAARRLPVPVEHHMTGQPPATCATRQACAWSRTCRSRCGTEFISPPICTCRTATTASRCPSSWSTSRTARTTGPEQQRRSLLLRRARLCRRPARRARHGRLRRREHRRVHAHEQEDGYDAIEWIAGQPWCNGQVGMWGTSYGGFTCMQVAMHRHRTSRRSRRCTPPTTATPTTATYPGGNLRMYYDVGTYGGNMVAMNALPP